MARLVDAAARSLSLTIALVIAASAVAVALGVAFKLTLAGSIALYFVVWWTALFAILPIRIRSQAEAGEIVPGTDPGAPAAPALRERAIWTTLVSAVIFGAVAALFPLAGL